MNSPTSAHATLSDKTRIHSSIFPIIMVFFMIFIIGSTAVVQGLPYYDLDLATPDAEKNADKKHWAYYDITITNTGEKDDTYQVTFDNPKDDTWGVAFADYIEDRIEISVKASESAIVNLSVHPSCGCEEGQNLYVNLTVYSKGDASVFDRIMVVTTYKVQNDVTDPNGGSDTPDSDNDGWTDAEELEYGTNPYDAGDYPILDKDSDNDGLSDAAEATWGTDPNMPDTDGDSYSDKIELEQGTDPLDPKSKPKSSSNNDGSGDTSGDGGSEETNIFGLSTDNGMYAILIPVLVIIVLASIIILAYVWRSGTRDEDIDDDEDDDAEFNGRSLEKEALKVKDEDKAPAKGKTGEGGYEILAAKLKRSGGGMYECPQCDNDFNLKDLKKHVLRKHHKRLKRL